MSHKSRGTSHESRVTSHKSRVTSHELQVMSHKSRVTSHESQVMSHKSQVTSHELQVMSHKSLVTIRVYLYFGPIVHFFCIRRAPLFSACLQFYQRRRGFHSLVQLSKPSTPPSPTNPPSSKQLTALLLRYFECPCTERLLQSCTTNTSAILDHHKILFWRSNKNFSHVLAAWYAFRALSTWSRSTTCAKDHRLFFRLNYPQINEVRKSSHVVIEENIDGVTRSITHIGTKTFSKVSFLST